MPSRPEAGPPIPVIFGPTAVGKSDLALDLAQRLPGEIVSLDSRQLYRGLDIGTAKPTAAERARAPHHLVDIAEPHQTLSLADLQGRAYGAIDTLLAGGRRPILVGGTGQYLRAVLEGWTIPQVAPDAAVRNRLAEEAQRLGPEALHARLAGLDPLAASRIDPRNARRTIRALEVMEHTGQPFSALAARREPPYSWLVISLSRPRESLYARIDARIDAMLAAGLEDEVRSLLERGHGFDLPAMQSVGYQEWAPYLRGEADRDAVVAAIRHNTRRLVRSQDSWLRSLERPVLTIDLEATGIDAAVGMVLGAMR